MPTRKKTLLWRPLHPIVHLTGVADDLSHSHSRFRQSLWFVVAYFMIRMGM